MRFTLCVLVVKIVVIAVRLVAVSVERKRSTRFEFHFIWSMYCANIKFLTKIILVFDFFFSVLFVLWLLLRLYFAFFV